MSKEEAQEAVGRLVAKYQSWSPRQRRLNEQQTRTQFILPLLQVLGWDVNNPAEVSEEFSVAGDRVDYALHIDGVPKLFLEAKKLGAELENEEYIKKAITYAQNKGITWVVLTNFEQLMVFNADWDDPFWQRARFLSLNFQDYISDFDQLWWLSREAVNLGVLEEEARKVGQLRPKLPVEKSLLEKLRRWRAELFNQIRQYNEGLSPFDIDHRIQLLLNRLIFIRAAEDRITKVGRLRAELNQWRHNERRGELIERLRSVFGEFAEQYDSDLFPNLAMPGQDPWSQLFVGSMALEEIIQGLYDRPGRLSGYDFSAIDADILGRVYEQYLGYVAQEIQQQFAQIPLMGPPPSFVELEEKRAKRKQQGIYYTPKFVVDYIVDQTVGRFLRERSHNEILNMKILDPACGSGSFLIAAYDRLLRYHAHQQGKSVSQLSPAQRAQFLTGNIFGVDLDLQAVEMARLNLLLKALFQAALLPPLHDNIRRGNSLISGTPEELKRYFGDNWRDKHPFNWEEQFPDIMKAGGFDVVIGNPPYVRFGTLPESERKYYGDSFTAAFKQYDIYVLFIEKSIRLLKEQGRLGFITSSKFFVSDYGMQIRNYILDNCSIEKVIDVSNFQVFKDAAIYPFAFALRKEANSERRKNNLVEAIIGLEDKEKLALSQYQPQYILQNRFKEREGYIFDVTLKFPDILEHVEKSSISLGSICKVTRGFRPPPNDLLLTKPNLEKLEKQEQNKYRKLVTGRDILGPYALMWRGLYVRYDHKRIYEAKPTEVFESPKIMITDVSYHPEAYYDSEGYYCLKTVYLILKGKEDANYDPRYITGIINSKLTDFLFRSQFEAMHLRGGYVRFRKQFLDQIAIRQIDFDAPEEKKMHDDLVALVERMLDLKKRWTELDRFAEEERREREREIERTNKAIDNLVYDLYGLTEEERRIIEAEVRR